MGKCQDQFNSKEELQEPELLNDIQDSASLCVVHPCLNSPWCPEIGWRGRERLEVLGLAVRLTSERSR